MGLKAGSIILNEEKTSSLPSGPEMYQACQHLSNIHSTL